LQVAGVDGGDRFVGQRLCQPRRLPLAVGVEGDIGVALDARVAVPGGFTMAHGQDAGDLQNRVPRCVWGGHTLYRLARRAPMPRGGIPEWAGPDGCRNKQPAAAEWVKMPAIQGPDPPHEASALPHNRAMTPPNPALHGDYSTLFSFLP